MPHLIIDYSGNLDARTDMAGLVQIVHEAAIATGVFPLGGIRTRAARQSHYRVADGDPENAYVHVTVRIGHGRPLEVQKQTGEAIMTALTTYLAPVFESSPLAISLEVQEIDPALSFRRNNLHERLKA